MKKTILFDMDGTIADLYNEKNWLDRLLSEQQGLFRNLKVMHDKAKLTRLLKDFISLGYRVEVITWTPKNVSQEYIEIVEQEKIDWIQEHFPMIEKIHCLPYGTPKQKANYKKSKIEILVDDNQEVANLWETPKQRKYILADSNLVNNLAQLV